MLVAKQSIVEGTFVMHGVSNCAYDETKVL